RTRRPTGGQTQYRESVYLDPFTQEPISVTFVRDDEGEVKLDANRNPIVERHDYWFQVRFKIMMKKEKESSPQPSATDTGRRL
ncbi:MAG: hypothetical protein JW810_04795, partial [Sedimentisphaerales bacterium]|nr:hypothetical protein [Sedimentisphaerales bacterium]